MVTLFKYMQIMEDTWHKVIVLGKTNNFVDTCILYLYHSIYSMTLVLNRMSLTKTILPDRKSVV